MSSKTEVDMLQVQHHKDRTLSIECNNNNSKMLLNSIKRDGDLKEEEEEVNSLSMNSSSDDSSINSTEESEIIQLQDEEEEEEEKEEEDIMDDYQMMLNRPGYKRMDLKGESESDKDLIIYSLNESLQIHKEIVERIQNEKDDLEDKFDQENVQENSKFLAEKEEINQKHEQVDTQVNKLETIYKNLLSELESKKLEYKRMETRFYSHVKSIRSSEDDMGTVYTQINQLFTQIQQLSTSTLLKVASKENIIEWWNQDIAIQESIQMLPINNDTTIISMLTEKVIVDIIVQEILSTAIHPGVSLNDSFGKIHDWVEKRNTSWASRMKQQISSFVVKQSNEENDKIEEKKKDIIQTILTTLSQVYHDVEKAKRKVTSIVNLAFKLNLAIKCQENPIDILHISQGSQLNENTMISINANGDRILLVITPPIVATGLNVPAKVYCCA